MLRSRRIQAYIFAELLLPTLLALALYGFTLLMNEFFLIAQKAVSKNLPWDLIFQLFAYQIPRVLVLAIPMAVLLGTLIALGRISSDHEWVALQAAGAGPGILLRPVILHGFLASVVSFYVYGNLLPACNYASRDLLSRVLVSSNLASDLRPRVFYDDIPGTVFFVNEIRAKAPGRLAGVFLYQTPETGAGSEQLILANSGDIYPAPAGETGFRVDLHDGILHSYKSSSPNEYVQSRFDRYVLPVDLPAYLKRAQGGDLQRSPQDMETPQLFHELDVARAEPDLVLRPYRVRAVAQELHQRFALPLAALLLSVVAAPLGITRARSGKGAGFAWSLMLIFAYWLVFTLGRGQVQKGRLPPFLGIWGANLLVLGWIGVQLIRRPFTARDGPGLFASIWLHALEALRSLRRRLTHSRVRSDADAAAPASLMRAPFGLVDRYIASQYLRMLGLALASAYLIYGIIELKSLADGVIEHRRPFGLILTYFKYFAPGMLQFAMPVSCLVASVVTFTLLSRRGEVTALKAGGMGVRRAVVPVVMVTALLCVALYVIQDQVAPVTNRKALEVRDAIFERAPRSYGFSTTGRWSFGTKDRLYQYRLYDSQEEVFQGLSVFTIDRAAPRVLAHRYLATAKWDGTLWAASGGWVRELGDGDSKGSYRMIEPNERLALDPPETFSRREQSLAGGSDLAEQMSLRDLQEQIQSLTDSGYDPTRLRVEFFAKLARPLTPLVMVLLGLPFAFRVGRAGSMYAVGVSLVLVIVYWATLAIFNALGIETMIPPALAAFAPNALFAVLGTYLLLLVRS